MRQRLGPRITSLYREDNPLPTTPHFTFFELAPQYRCTANRRTERERIMVQELQENMPLLMNLPNGTRVGRFIGVYGRILEYYPRRRGRKCLQYLYVWDGQLLLPHPMDYAPVFIYFDDYRQDKFVYWDSYHYNQGRETLDRDEQLVFKISKHWHSFDLIRDFSGNDYDIEVEYCTDDHLWHWWDFRKNSATLKLVNEMRDPEILVGMQGLMQREPARRYLSNLVKKPFLAIVHRESDLMDALHTFAYRLVRPFADSKQFSFATDFTLGSLILLDAFYQSKLIYMATDNLPQALGAVVKAVSDTTSKKTLLELRELSRSVRPEELVSLYDGIDSRADSFEYFQILQDSIKEDKSVLQDAEKELANLISRIEHSHFE